MKHEDDDSQNSHAHDDHYSNPWNPFARSQIQFSFPTCLPFVVSIDRGDDNYLGIRYDTLHIDIMLPSMFSRSDKQILDVVVGPPETEVRVWGEEGLVRCLR